MKTTETPTVQTLLAWATSELRTASVPSAALDADVLLVHVLQKDRSWLRAHSDESVSSANAHIFTALARRRANREPVAYLIGTKEFYGRTFDVTPDVLIPRPETESLIDVAKSLPLPADAYAIDVGTGSGCVGLTLAAEIPNICRMALADISTKALDVAKQNQRRLVPRDHVEFYQTHLLSFWLEHPHEKPSPSLIVANLPYVDASWETSPETRHEPSLALYADAGGLALIVQLIDQAHTVLAPRGYLVLEADPEQFPSIVTACKKHALSHVTTKGYGIVFQKL